MIRKLLVLVGVLSGCGAARREPVADVAPPGMVPVPVEAPTCAGLADLPAVEVDLLDEQLLLEVPMGTVTSHPLGGDGVPLSILERRLEDGAKVVFWATRFPARLGNPLDPKQLAAPYAARWPEVEVVPLADAWAIELHGEYRMPEPWTELERVLEITRAAPGGNLWTLTVFVSRGLATAEPEACRAAVARWALTVRETDAVRPVAGPVCVSGGSGLSSFTWSVPPGEGWFRVRRVDRIHRVTYDLLERWPLPASAPSHAWIRLDPRGQGPEADPAADERADGSLGGLPATWSTAELRRDGDDAVRAGVRTWAEAEYGADVLSVSLTASGPGELKDDRESVRTIALNNVACN